MRGSELREKTDNTRRNEVVEEVERSENKNKRRRILEGFRVPRLLALRLFFVSPGDGRLVPSRQRGIKSRESKARENEASTIHGLPRERRRKKNESSLSGLMFFRNQNNNSSHRDAVWVLVSDPAGLGLALFCSRSM